MTDELRSQSPLAATVNSHAIVAAFYFKSCIKNVKKVNPDGITFLSSENSKSMHYSVISDFTHLLFTGHVFHVLVCFVRTQLNCDLIQLNILKTSLNCAWYMQASLITIYSAEVMQPIQYEYTI